ncbi:MAG: radical SAM protein [Methylocystis sp.]|uniref:radical SAM protein n=1 Tax=Methylocystis sp. TaxID=1911079 RepID=UPI003DA51C8D
MTTALVPARARRGSPVGRAIGEAAAPRAAAVHLFEADSQPHVLVVEGSQIFGVDAGAFATLERAIAAGDDAVDRELTRLGIARTSGGSPFVDDAPPASPPVRALSLAVAQKCNLACSYCYAREGSFGGEPAAMSLDMAHAAVDKLLADVVPGERINLSFLGGEPLANRVVLRAATERAAELAAARDVVVTFSITTNGTLVTPDDGAFFERYGFAVTVSLDGIGEVHDRQRPFKSGRGSYARILDLIAPLLAMQRRMQVSARVTVTPRNLALRDSLDALIALGFHSVGFSPMLASPTNSGELAAPDLDTMLAEMISCGRAYERAVRAGQRYAFANMTNAMRELARGTHRPYPCGAGAGYLSVSAAGDLSACHRFIGDPAGALGSLAEGIDAERRAAWLGERHVHRQEPCRRCWARYMCGGGCHHEVIHRGRPACDYIRGWLHYCLGAYVRLADAAAFDA